MSPETETPELPSKPTISTKWLIAAFVVVDVIIIAAVLFFYFVSAPGEFPTTTTVTIEPGSSAAVVAESLESQAVVRSDVVLYAVLSLWHDPSQIKAGTYTFDRPVSVFAVANRIVSDTPQAELVRLTLPEGFTVREFARIAVQVLPDFDSESFVEKGLEREGFLFPDTYFVPIEFTAEELLTLLIEAYDSQTESLQPEIEASGLSEAELITLASILEREANTEQSMKMVAGVLRSRLEIGMPLQADASIEYVLDKTLSELTAGDLDIASPYNTYLNTGLPPTPIGNPGLQAITAVLQPIESEYLFYITGNDGEFYYAITYDEHRANIARYLR